MAGLDEEIAERMNRRLLAAIRSGELLTEQKKAVGRRWGRWIKENLPYSHSTVNRYMNLYREKEKFVNLTNLGLCEAYRNLTDPKERPEDRIETEPELDRMAQELKARIQDRSENEPSERLNKPQKQEGRDGPQDEGEIWGESIDPDDDQNSLSEADHKTYRLLKLAERGTWEDALRELIEIVNLAGDQTVQARLIGAREVFQYSTERKVAQVIDGFRTVLKKLELKDLG